MIERIFDTYQQNENDHVQRLEQLLPEDPEERLRIWREANMHMHENIPLTDMDRVSLEFGRCRQWDVKFPVLPPT
jgi:hypothetical protein